MNTAIKRGPYKRGAKSIETAPVVGVHEEAEAPPMPKLKDYGWRPDVPGAKSGRGRFDTRAQEDAYNEALAAFHFWNRGKDAPLPIAINRPNIPNRYDREALRDFYTAFSLSGAQKKFDFAKSSGLDDKNAFVATLIMLPPIM